MISAEELAWLEYELGQTDLRCYTPGNLANYISGWQMFPHMEQIQDVWLRLWAGEFNQLIVQCPPQHGKSMYISGATIPWALGVDPSLRVALCSYTSSVAEKWGENARNFFAEHGPDLFKVQLSPTKRAKKDFELQGCGGGMITRGVGGSLTGNPVDYGVIDDYFKDARQARSPTLRQAVWDWYVTVFLTRLSKRAKVVIMNTRWDLDDLAGRLLQAQDEGNGERWYVLNLPAIAPAPEEVPEESRRLFFPDPCGRAPGEPLCPQLHPLDKLMMLRKTQGEEWFWAMCQGLPRLGTGNFVREEDFKYWEWSELPVAYDARNACYFYPDHRFVFDEVIQSWDTKYAKNNGAAGSFVVGQVWGRKGARAFLLDEVRGRWGLEETITQVKLLSKKWPMAGMKLFEAKANGPNICRRLQDTIPGCYPWPVEGDKLTRALAIVHWYFASNVFIPGRHLAGWVREHVAELCGFPGGIYADRVDAASQALAWFERCFGSGGVLRVDRPTE